MKKEAGIKYKKNCLLCLSSNRRTIDILNTNLQPLYEKLINREVEYGAPMCFICHRRLQQCHQFVTLIKETQSLRENYIKNGYMTESKPVKPLVQLSTCTVMNFGIPFGDSITEGITIKEEPEIKDEPESEVEDIDENGVEDNEEDSEYESEEPSIGASSESEDSHPEKENKRKRGLQNRKQGKETQYNNKRIKK